MPRYRTEAGVTVTVSESTAALMGGLTPIDEQPLPEAESSTGPQEPQPETEADTDPTEPQPTLLDEQPSPARRGQSRKAAKAQVDPVESED